MGLELFNKTNRIKDVPKFNYNGRIKLGPGKSYPIRDYMMTFYKPYERIGVIVRNSVSVETTSIEPEVKKVLDIIEDEKKLNKAEDKIIEQVSKLGESDKETIDAAGNSKEEAIQDIELTKETLDEMKMNDLKKIMEEKGIPVPEKYKKEEYVKAILDFKSK